MIKLTSINISKYKSIVDSQDMKVEEGVTTLVGMNESGKTAILETIAKANYFEEDSGSGSGDESDSGSISPINVPKNVSNHTNKNNILRNFPVTRGRLKQNCRAI